jgi:hypothetical protein
MTKRKKTQSLGLVISTEPLRLYVDANNPIWNPREYFLIILENQMCRVVKEWEYVVRQLQRSVKQFVCSAFVSQSRLCMENLE